MLKTNPNSEGFAAIKHFCIIKTIIQTRYFFGLSNFFRKLIPRFPEIISPTTLSRYERMFHQKITKRYRTFAVITDCTQSHWVLVQWTDKRCAPSHTQP